ncbi:TauD/TfdA family dioxygenase [Sphingobium sp. DC-2]|uniref:TauD/TfdA dioxygenase family protein n=1 Tax=Sphingobium sp. DC-2 TaxID=1303256 RepID=UPI0004C43466|nr:TauD/TfdA family dioxygenase [Sphingobium sp. DC-2]
MQGNFAFETKALEPFGVEVVRDLSVPMSEGEGEALRDLFYREKLLLFRNQSITEDQHAALLAHIGPVLGSRGEYREISSDGNLGAGPLCWHSDLSFTPEPFKGLSLYALEVNPGQSATRFASATRAVTLLPDALRARVAGMDAVALISPVQSHRQLAYTLPPFFPQQTRPAILPHPETGEPVLYVSQMQTARIGGLPQEEGESLLEELFSTLYAPENVYEHRWYDGDLVIWDNIALQHSRPDLTTHTPRRLRRIALAAKSFFDLCPQFDLNDPRVAAWARGDIHALDEIAEEAG